MDSLQKENKELDFIEMTLKKQLKQIKDNSNECQINSVIETSGTPPLKPEKSFQFASELFKSGKKSSNGLKCEPPVVDLISDSDSVISDEKHETIDSFPPICATFEPKPQISLNVDQNERIAEIVVRSEENVDQNERIWERKRRLKRQKLSNDD